MDTKKLRQKILDLAIHGKLVPQDPNDEPASVLLERIRAEKERLIKEGKIKQSKRSAKSSDTPHYKNEVPFEMPEGWVWTTINDICSKIGSGSTPRGSNYAEKGIPFFRSQNVYNDGLVYDDIKYITEDVHKMMIGTEVRANDLLLNITGGSLGRCAIVPNEFCKGNVSQHVCILRTIIALPAYLHLFIISDYFAATMILSGSGREGLPKYSLEIMQFPLPPLTEQHRIVAAVEQWFSLIDTLESAKEDLQTSIVQAKSKILDLAIHGKLVPQDPSDEPAIGFLKRINPKFVPCDNAHYENIPFDIPESWVWTCMAEVNEYKSASVDPSKYPDNDFELYSVPAYETGMPEFVKGKYISSSKKSVSRNDVLLCKINPHLNRVWIVSHHKEDIPCLASSEWIIFRNSTILPQYLSYCFTSLYFKELMLSNVSGVGGSLMRAQPTIVSKYLFPLPPENEQRKIVEAIQQYYNVLDNIRANL